MRLLYQWLLQRSLIAPLLAIRLFPPSPASSQTNKVFRGIATVEKGASPKSVSVTFRGNSLRASTGDESSFSVAGINVYALEKTKFLIAE